MRWAGGNGKTTFSVTLQNLKGLSFKNPGKVFLGIIVFISP